MKTISTELRNHLDLTVTTLATCWKITRRDGVEKFFTDHDRNITFDGDLYEAFGGYSRTAIQNDDSFSVDNLDVSGFTQAGFVTDADVRAGLYDGAEVHIFAVNWADLTQGEIKLRRGKMGEVQTTKSGLFIAELRGLTAELTKAVLPIYQPECRADLGDVKCSVPIDPALVARNTAYTVGQYVKVVTLPVPVGTYEDYQNRIYRCTTAGTTHAMTEPTYDTTVDNTTTDGTAVFTAQEAWTRDAIVVYDVMDMDPAPTRIAFAIDVVEPRAVDDWFKYGGLTFESGPNAGITREIKGYAAMSGIVELFAPFPYIPEAGDQLRLYRGCDKSRTRCILFENIVNFRGEPYMTGNDFLLGAVVE